MASMEEAVAADLKRWGPSVFGTALAELALDAARRLDDPKLSPTPAALLHTQLRAELEALAEMAPAEATSDAIDELKKRRSDRRGA